MNLLANNTNLKIQVMQIFRLYLLRVVDQETSKGNPMQKAPTKWSLGRVDEHSLTLANKEAISRICTK